MTLTDRGHGPVMAEGVPLAVTLPAQSKRVRCWALAPDGTRKEEVPVKSEGALTRLDLGPAYRTVWYEIDIN